MLSKQKGFGNMDDDLNEISMIKASTNTDSNLLNEESFNLDLLKNMMGSSKHSKQGKNTGKTNKQQPLFSKYLW